MGLIRLTSMNNKNEKAGIKTFIYENGRHKLNIITNYLRRVNLL